MAVLILAGTHAVSLTSAQVVLGLLLPLFVSACGQWIFSAPQWRQRAVRLLTATVPIVIIVWDCGAWGFSCWPFW